MDHGRVYWITGLSNSGKTTIGSALYYNLRKTKNNVVILDGDIMKDITTLNDGMMYAGEGRLARAERYSSLSKILSDQGITVIVCTISMFDSIRDWNRKNIKGYIEIFLNPPVDVLKSRDKKGLLDYPVSDTQFPKDPDAEFKNDGKEKIIDIVSRIQSLIPRNEEDFDRDKEYWNDFYDADGLKIVEPSQFAADIIKELKPNSHLLELGCGNGRDSLFFLENGLRVTALDASDVAVNKLNEITYHNDKALFVCDDFVKSKSLYQLKYDYIYSRFTLHAINEEQEDELLRNIKEALYKNGKFFVEARTIHDEIYGKGTKISKNAFIYNEHYRRFIDPDVFKNKLEKIGFEIVYLEERNGFSMTKESDPVLMRCIAKLQHGGGIK